MSQVQSKYISKSEYGIITLIINTVDKWLGYYIDTTQKGLVINLSTEIYCEEDDTYERYKEAYEIQWDEIDLNLVTEFNYQRFVIQNKDQIVIYWIPTRLFKNGDKVKYEHG